MMRRTSLAWVPTLVLLAQGGCATTTTLLRGPLLDFIGPTTAVAVAQPNGVAEIGQAVVLDGTSSFLQFGSGTTIGALSAGLSYAWSIASPDTPAAALENVNSSHPTFTATDAGSYTVQLTVSVGTITGTSSLLIEVLE